MKPLLNFEFFFTLLQPFLLQFRHKSKAQKVEVMKKSVLPLFVLFISSFLNLTNAQNCVDSSLMNPNAGCFDIYVPVCGCDGVTYSNSCYALIFGGVTSFTDGPCSGGIIDAEPCTDLAGVDFGVCAMYMGITIINGQCIGISGCGWEVDGINYQTASYDSMEACQACLNDTIVFAEPCSDLAEVDFGPCDMILGYAVIGNTCELLSGCGSIANNIDFQNALYATEAECELCLSSNGILEDAFGSIVVYPNPVQEVLHIQSNMEINHIKIFNIAGNVIFESNTQGQEYSLDIQNWSSGLYFVQIHTTNNVLITKVLAP